jgi:hypothetical protein
LGLLKPFQLFFRIAGFISLRRLPSELGLLKPFQLFFRIAGFISLRRLPSELGLLKPFQQNASHFVGFFASHLFTKASF